ncbi:hypothetical protein Y887_10830 [Xanthomonas pisi DSM 18956]|uniref:Transposase n=1 Tax=Xanthomonas pisi TaxID=56457 RepID=A0A2S7D2J3_9XANT|nr:hypothetical protein Y887_10830 [Xanthomonas pisi DSM 18956]PPU68063.1 hypothetical protein XpiCFBP4643_12660 [Xanthomonas pisi]
MLKTHDQARKLFNRVNARLSHKGQSLRGGTIVDAKIHTAPGLANNKDGERDLQTHQTNKGDRY